MSAFYSMCHHDRIEILTDGAIYSPDGILLETREKVWRSSHLPLAVTGRGHAESLDTFANAVLLYASLGTFDATMQRVISLLDRWREKGAPHDFEMLIAGMSEATGPVHAYFTTASYMEGWDAWRLCALPEDFGGGVGDITAEDLTAAGIELGGVICLADIGVRMFEMMRAKKGPNPLRPDLPELHGIGGHVDLTIITREGVTTQRLHTWPDVVGEKIDPSRKADEDDRQFRMSGAAFLDRDAA